MHVFSRLIQKSKVLRCYSRSNFQFKFFKHHIPTKAFTYVGISCFGIYIGSYWFLNKIRNADCLSFNSDFDNINYDKSKQHSFSYLDMWEPSYHDIILFVLAIMSAIIAAIVNIEIPLKLGSLTNVLATVNTTKKSDYFQLLKVPSLKLLLCYMVQALSTTSYISLLSIIGEHLAVSLKKRLYERIIVQDAKFFDTTRTGDLINRITADVQDFKSSFKQCISQGLRSFITIIGSTIALICVSRELTAMIVVTVPSLVLIGSIMGRVLRALSRKAQIQNSKATEVANEGIANIRTVKSFAMEDVEIETFSLEIKKAGKLHTLLGVGIGIFQGLSNLAVNGIVFGVLFVGGYMMHTGSLTPGDLMSFLVASQTIQKSLSTISSLLGHLVKANASGSRISEFLTLHNCDTSPDLHELRERRKKKRYRYKYSNVPVSIEFRNISFAYPTRTEQSVLKNFSLFIPEGSIFAFCGESGAGKSTLSNLIQRLYDPDSGDILIGGRKIKYISVSELRSDKIGVVSQQPQLFAKSIRENIRYGRMDATDLEVEEASKLAYAHDFIVGFENGYNTVVGERGGEALSGGQRQRIAIARAILRNPSILILDEATSALDSKSEVFVQEALKNLMRGRTVIIIAHRLSTIEKADQIVVLKKGEIVEMGSHDSLLKRKGYYYDLIEKLQEKNK